MRAERRRPGRRPGGAAGAAGAAGAGPDEWHPLELALATLAVWRLTHLLAQEDGPADVIARARARAGDTLLGDLMDCFNCLSMWVAAGVAPLVSRRARDIPVTWLALSGAACLLQRASSGGEPVLDIARLVEGGSDGMLRTEPRGGGDGRHPSGHRQEPASGYQQAPGE